MHVYLMVDCKTENCDGVLLLRDLGQKGQITEVSLQWPVPWMLECPICHELHDYSDSEKRMYRKELAEKIPS